MAQPRFEVLTGVVDGVNRTFTTSQPYATGTTALYVNGQLRRLHTTGILDGYVETDPTTGVVTLDEAPLPADVVQLFYLDTAPIVPETEITELDAEIDDFDTLDGVIVDIEILAGEFADYPGDSSMTCSTTAVTGIFIVRGESKTYEVVVRERDKAKSLVDLTGAKAWMTVKRRIEDATPLILKRNAAAGGDITQAEILMPQSLVANKGRLRFNFSPSDTATLLDGADYVCDVWVELASGKRKPVIKKRPFTVGAAVTTDF